MIAVARSFAALLVVTSTLSACSGTSQYENDPLFKQAYEQGCRTAAGYIPGDKSTLERDDALFKSNEAYSSGWRAGYRACKIGHPQSESPGAPDSYGGRRNGPSGY